MSDRLLNVLVAAAGLLAVGVLALLGYDAYRAARSGPRWRRRLLTGGLGLLAALGAPACSSAADAPAAQGAPDRKDLTDSAEWQRIESIWREAGEIASGKRGPYPFDAAGKKRVLAALEGAGKDVEALQRRALVSDTEAGLLKIELARLTLGVNEKRPTEMRMATCYEPLPMCYAAMQSAKRLASRLPLLEKLVAAQQVQATVAGKVLAAVEADLAMLADEKRLAGYPPAEKPKMEETRKAAAALVARLKAVMEKP